MIKKVAIAAFFILRYHFYFFLFLASPSQNQPPRNPNIYNRLWRYPSSILFLDLNENIFVCCSLQGNDSNLLIVFYVQIMPDDFVMQLHRF